MSTQHDPTIVALIYGRTVGRGEVLAWENRRIDAAAKKLGIDAPAAGGTEARREAFLSTKLALGSSEIESRLSRDIHWAERVSKVGARVSSRRRRSITDLQVAEGSAAHFAEWFDTCSRDSDERAMLRACPDHFVIRTGTDGRQEVIETTGGSPMAARFYVDYSETSSLVTPPDPNFPHQIAGVARAADGTPVGGVRHQFRDLDKGFQARLTVEFPLPSAGMMITQHRWHLACEFSNWITAAAKA